MLWDFMIYLQFMFWVLCYSVCIYVCCMYKFVYVSRFAQVRSLICLCEACMSMYV